MEVIFLVPEVVQKPWALLGPLVDIQIDCYYPVHFPVYYTRGSCWPTNMSFRFVCFVSGLYSHFWTLENSAHSGSTFSKDLDLLDLKPACPFERSLLSQQHLTSSPQRTVHLTTSLWLMRVRFLLCRDLLARPVFRFSCGESEQARAHRRLTHVQLHDY